MEGSLDDEHDYLKVRISAHFPVDGHGEHNHVWVAPREASDEPVPLERYMVLQSSRTIEYSMETSLRATLIFESCILILSNFFFFYLVKKWEAENAIKFSQRKVRCRGEESGWSRVEWSLEWTEGGREGKGGDSRAVFLVLWFGVLPHPHPHPHPPHPHNTPPSSFTSFSSAC